MCLVIKAPTPNPFLPENSVGLAPMVSDTDLVVWKVMRVERELGVEKYYAPFYRTFEYRLDETYESECEPVKLDLLPRPNHYGPLWVIEQGLHALADRDSGMVLKVIMSGSKHGPTYRMVRCVIPAGTPYWVGVWTYKGARFGSVATSKMVVRSSDNWNGE